MTLKWQEYYKSRTIDARTAAEMVQPNWTMMMSIGATPTSAEVYAEIVKRKDQYENVRINECLIISPNIWLDRQTVIDSYPKITGSTGYAIGPNRNMFSEKLRDILISGAYDGAEHMGYECDMWFVTTTRPDKNGFVNLSLNNFFQQDGIRIGRQVGKNKITIAECNDQLPTVFGDSFMHVSEIDYFIEISKEPPYYSPAGTEPAKEELSMAQYVIDQINDGDIVQVGIGPIPETVSRLLDGKHDLGIVTEVFVNGHLDMIEKGIVTNMKKPDHLYKGISIFAFILGDKKLYDYCAENYATQIHSGYKVAHPMFIGQHPNFVAMNNALMIDLTGQINCEGFGHRQISGVGGQFHFQLGSRFSPGGRAITLIKAASKNPDGSLRSAIVPEFIAGTPVSVGRTWADIIITEYGAVDIRYKTARNRADALISIAHPDFRGELRKAARRNLWPAFDQG